MARITKKELIDELATLEETADVVQYMVNRMSIDPEDMQIMERTLRVLQVVNDLHERAAKLYDREIDVLLDFIGS